MKLKTLPLILAAALLAACTSQIKTDSGESDNSEIQKKVDDIEDVQIKSLDEQIDSITALLAAIDTTSELQESDITDLEEMESKFSEALENAKASVSEITDGNGGHSGSSLDAQLAEIQKRLEALEKQMEALRKQIESLKENYNHLGDIIDNLSKISYIKKYDDSAERVTYQVDTLAYMPDTLKMNFDLHSVDAAETVASKWKSALSVRAVHTATKASAGDIVSLEVTGASANDGILSVRVWPRKLDRDFIDGKLAVSVSLIISAGQKRVESDYISLLSEIADKGTDLSQYLLDNFDSNGDGVMSDGELAAIEELNISGMGLTDIGWLLGKTVNLKSLDCSGNALTTLDVSALSALEALSCQNNQLTAVDLSNNGALTSLDCSNNKLTSLDLSKNERLTSVNLSENANLTKVVCKSETWLMDGNRTITSDASAVFYQSNGGRITLTSVTMVIDGKTWKQFNVGATVSDIRGACYNFDNAQTACPSGWRVPTEDELIYLSANYSDWTTYFGVKGRWFSGSQTYSSTASAIFLPVRDYDYDSSYGRYWSSKEGAGGIACCLSFYSENVSVGINYRSREYSVRCLKD